MVIVAGYGAVIYTVGGCVQMLIDGELNRALGVRRMTKGIERLRGHTIVCGIGRLGSILARELHDAGKPFVAIDGDLESIPRCRGAWLPGHPWRRDRRDTSCSRLESDTRRPWQRCLSQDATNVFVTVTAREMNPSVTIIARGENPRTEKKLLGCGANRVVLPTAIGAKKLAQLITRPTAENMLEQIQDQSSMIDDLRPDWLGV